MPRITADDERLAATLKAIRRRSNLTQEAVAAQAGVPARDVMSIEAGRASDVRLGRDRAVFLGVDGAARLSTWWHGSTAGADRLPG